LIKTRDKVKPYFKDHSLNLQSQDLEEIYAPNGSLYITSVKNLKKNKSFFSKETMFIESYFKYEDIDIDNKSDLEFAEMVLKKYKKKIKKELIFENKIYQEIEKDIL